MRLARERSECFVGRAEQGRRFIEYDRDGNIAQEAFEFPFVAKGFEEGAVFDFFNDFDRDAAGNIDATERENFKSEVAGFCAIDGGPEIQSVGANGALFGKPKPGDFRGGIHTGILKGMMYDARIEEFVECAEAAA